MSKAEIKDRLTAVPHSAEKQPEPALARGSLAPSAAAAKKAIFSNLRGTPSGIVSTICAPLNEAACAIFNGVAARISGNRSILRQRTGQAIRSAQRSKHSRLSAGISIYINWVRRWKTIPVSDWINGAIAFESGNFKRAAELYRRGLDRKPGHIAAAHARFDCGYCLYRLGDIAAARQMLTEAISGNNKLRDAYLLLARIHLIFGHNRSAQQTLKRCAELLPDDISALTSYFHLMVASGTESSRMGMLRDELIQAKLRLPLDDFGQEQIDGCLAAYELRYGSRQRGERLLARVLASGRAPYDVILLRGEQFLAENRVVQAREQFSRAARIAPRDPRPFMFLAKTYLAEGPFQEIEWGLQSATTACRLSSYQNSECISALVSAYELNGECDVALLFIERMRDLPSTRQMNVEQLTRFKKELERLRQINT